MSVGEAPGTSDRHCSHGSGRCFKAMVVTQEAPGGTFAMPIGNRPGSLETLPGCHRSPSAFPLQ